MAERTIFDGGVDEIYLACRFPIAELFFPDDIALAHNTSIRFSSGRKNRNESVMTLLSEWERAADEIVAGFFD